MQDLTGFQRDLLIVTGSMASPSGSRIHSAIDEYYEQAVTNARLYRNLDRLAVKGLIAKTTKDGRTNAYSLTNRGKRELRARRQWEDSCLLRPSGQSESAISATRTEAAG